MALKEKLEELLQKVEHVADEAKETILAEINALAEKVDAAIVTKDEAATAEKEPEAQAEEQPAAPATPAAPAEEAK